ncbi:MAG: hypothetical protein JNM18_01030 [Planctomycetaceae bacterium]|nr:hypothetical protein [Planctomycetaceae bacterium]
MSFSTFYPKLHQWLSHGGEMWVRPAADGGVEVSLGDAGGFSQDAPSHGATLNEALLAAETDVGVRLQLTLRLQQELVSDNLTDLQCDEFIRVAGWPPVRNPHYRK